MRTNSLICESTKSKSFLKINTFSGLARKTSPSFSTKRMPDYPTTKARAELALTSSETVAITMASVSSSILIKIVV